MSTFFSRRNFQNRRWLLSAQGIFTYICQVSGSFDGNCRMKQKTKNVKKYEWRHKNWYDVIVMYHMCGNSSLLMPCSIPANRIQKACLVWDNFLGDFHQWWYYDVNLFSRKNFQNRRWLLPAHRLSAYTWQVSQRSDENCGLWNQNVKK